MEKINKRNFLGFLKSYRNVFFFSFLVASVTGVFAWQRGEKYSISLTITLSRQETQNVTDYKYDSYYAILATDEFSETLSGWFKTPEMTEDIYYQASLPLKKNSLNNLARRFRAEKISPHVVEIRFGASSESEGLILAQAIKEVLEKRISLLNSASAQGLNFTILSSNPIIVKNIQTIFWQIVAGFFTGLTVGWFIKSAKEYFA